MSCCSDTVVSIFYEINISKLRHEEELLGNLRRRSVTIEWEEKEEYLCKGLEDLVFYTIKSKLSTVILNSEVRCKLEDVVLLAHEAFKIALFFLSSTASLPATSRR